MSNTNEEGLVPSLSQEDEDLKYTRELRKTIIEGFKEKGTLTKDTKELMVISGLLADIDRTAMQSKKIKSDEKAAKNNGESAALIAEMLSKISGVTMSKSASNQSAEAPVMPSDQAAIEITPGLLDQNAGNTTYSEFIKQMNEKKSELDEE